MGIYDEITEDIIIEEILKDFPRLSKDVVSITSKCTEDYNCIAWAVEVTDDWWWPIGGEYWPSEVPHERTVTAFTQAFATKRYVPCTNSDLEGGFQKIALFVNESEKPTHAARQLPSGKWTSKLGDSVDIEHPLNELEEGYYGKVILFFKKPIS